MTSSTLPTPPSMLGMGPHDHHPQLGLHGHHHPLLGMRLHDRLYSVSTAGFVHVGPRCVSLADSLTLQYEWTVDFLLKFLIRKFCFFPSSRFCVKSSLSLCTLLSAVRKPSLETLWLYFQSILTSNCHLFYNSTS